MCHFFHDEFMKVGWKRMLLVQETDGCIQLVTQGIYLPEVQQSGAHTTIWRHHLADV